MLGDPEWEPWLLGTYFPGSCAGHAFAYSSVQVADMKRSAEKNHRSTGKFQVLHMHGPEERCADACQVYGTEVPRLG